MTDQTNQNPIFPPEGDTEGNSGTVSCADETEDLIAELCVNAPSEKAKFCLRQYQYGKTVFQIHANMNKMLKKMLTKLRSLSK